MSAARGDALRIANCSGFFGDRLSAAREMVEGGPIDVLTGDWLAELTMLILARQRMKDPARGFARTFLTQMEEVLGTCIDRGIKVVSNAGGLNPEGCAAAVQELADRLDLDVDVAYVEGDDLIDGLDDLRAEGVTFANLDTGEKLDDLGVTPITANAYLGGFGIAEALEQGADVVVTGRVTDAALVVGPAIAEFGWTAADLDALAGAVVAGHVIECGAQATGGNYSFFWEVPGLEHPGFPIAGFHDDGSAVITKHPGSGGLVSAGTVTAQLLYEIGSARYPNPDVTARFDTIRLREDGPDRVRISGARGEPPPPTTKVAMNYLGGFRNSMTFGLTGLQIEEKAELAERTLWAHIEGGRESFDVAEVNLVRSDRADPHSNDEAVAELRISVQDADQAKVGRAFSNAVVEMALSSYPGFFPTSPPAEATPFGVYWPTTVPSGLVRHEVVVEAGSGPQRIRVPHPDRTQVLATVPDAASSAILTPSPTVRVPLGWIVGARSGDKGGNANVGFWTVDDAAFAWLDAYLTVARFKELLPEAARLTVERHRLANLRAVNFVVVGLLGRGVAASTRTDPQAKGLGEFLRARLVDIPTSLLPPELIQQMQ